MKLFKTFINQLYGIEIDMTATHMALWAGLLTHLFQEFLYPLCIGPYIAYTNP